MGQFPLSSIVLENWFCNHKAALQRSPMQLKNILVNGDTAPDFLSTWGRTENKMFICEWEARLNISDQMSHC